MLDVKDDGPVRTLTLARPEVRNAFNDELISALKTQFQNPGSARAIIVRGEGAAFCAGGDLQWMKKAANYTREQNIADAMNLAEMLHAVSHCPAVVIAMVQGAAFGGGCGLVAAADVAIAQEGTKFAFSEVKLGLIAATISAIVIPKIGAGHARSLFATGEVFETDKALRIGLVHDVAADAEAAEKILSGKLKAILSAGPSSVAASKQLVLTAPHTLEKTAEMLADRRATDEGKEGVAAFLDKRKASFVVESPL